MIKSSIKKPLEDILVVDFTQFLSGPSATLRLQDLGARVIKIEHYERGDLCRNIYASHLKIGEESAFFQAINRGKESVCANLTSEAELEFIRKIIAKADVVVHNFRPKVMERLGLGYEDVKKINANITYAVISGYGNEGPWQDKPGQDLLLQGLSGATWLSGQDSDGPVPMGLAVADIFAGAQLVQGILAALLCDETTLVEVSMLESMLDFQFEPLTLYFQDGGQPLTRGNTNAAHALVGAPYGLYKTTTGYIALAMGAIPILGELLGCDPLLAYVDSATWFANRDEIKTVLAAHLNQQSSEYWLAILEPADIWCAEVLNWQQLIDHEAFKILDMLQTVEGSEGETSITTRCPIKLDGGILNATVAAPTLGQHQLSILREFF